MKNTTSNQKKDYMTITSHYIDGNWKLQNQIMSLKWNFDTKLSTLTLDNCSTNDAIVDKLLGTLTTSSLILKGKIFHMRCCEHIINLIVHNGFSLITSAIENARNSVSFWTSSPKRIQYFRLFARQVGVGYQSTSSPTNSIYMTLSVALEYREVFNHLSKKDKHYICLLIEDERIWHQIWKVPHNSVIKYMASTMLVKFEKYWNVIHNVAIVLDPNYKLKLIKYKKKHDDKRGASWKRRCATNVSHGGGSTLSKSTRELDFENMLYEEDGFEKTELDGYLADKLLPNEEGFYILMWWKCNGSKFPILQKIARDILAIPISTVASESAFSMSGNKNMDELGISPKFKEGGEINFLASVVDEDEDEDEVTDSRMGTEMYMFLKI
uniref:HAT C-terminal dimerisation domain-containing protein n=1 Tax=Lactuca sativa TaxID=4236 RepID=A0A9R1XJ32_LACSA|nr:hypothetical protein LSAT_V11C300137950 [Lactuca sativa]